MTKPKLSIIILSWNTKELLNQCLRSLVVNPCLSAGRRNVEIIIVDNGSADGSPEMVKKQFPEARLIENKENLGFAKGNNQALRQAQGEFVLLLNSDTIIKAGALEKLLVYVGKNSDSAVSPLLVLPNGRPQVDYYMRFPNLWQVFFYHCRLCRFLIMKTPFKRLICQEPKKEPFLVDQLPGAALLASKTVWEKVGLLSEDFPFLFEDVDWCWRAKKAGVKLTVIPDAKVTHVGGASWKKRKERDSQSFYYQFFAAMLFFVRRNYSPLAARVFSLAIVFNFVFTLKVGLAAKFLKNSGKQISFLK